MAGLDIRWVLRGVFSTYTYIISLFMLIVKRFLRICKKFPRKDAYCYSKVALHYVSEFRSLLVIHLLPSPLVCLDVLVKREADIIREIRYLAGLMRLNCHVAWWRVERILSKLEEGESLDTTITSIELSDARKELHLLMRSIEHMERVCETKSPNDC